MENPPTPPARTSSCRLNRDTAVRSVLTRSFEKAGGASDHRAARLSGQAMERSFGTGTSFSDWIGEVPFDRMPLLHTI